MKRRSTILALMLACTSVMATDHGTIKRQALTPPLVTPAAVGDRNNSLMPWVAIIIDDMGNQESDRQAVLLPGPVACSFLPHTPHAVELAQLAARNGKEVLLHQPMQSSGGNKLGPGALLLGMSRPTFRDTLNSNLAALPHVSGVNNHMGSLLTRHQKPMAWFMAELSRYPSIFFLDSRTTPKTVAFNTALEHQVPSSSRDIFLDNETGTEALLMQFDRLIKLAKTSGSAIAIGHPHAQTLAFLQTHLPKLKQQGVDLRPVSDIIRLRKPTLLTAWRQPSNDHQVNQVR